jgi:hypothetical protein
MTVKMLPSNFVSGDWLIREGDDHEYTRNSIVMNEVSVGTAVVPFTIPSGTILDATGGAVGTLPNAISGILLRDCKSRGTSARFAQHYQSQFNAVNSSNRRRAISCWYTNYSRFVSKSIG